MTEGALEVMASVDGLIEGRVTSGELMLYEVHKTQDTSRSYALTTLKVYISCPTPSPRSRYTYHVLRPHHAQGIHIMSYPLTTL